jgi:hypothetical protein
MKNRQLSVRLDARDHQRLKEYVHRARDDLSMADLCRAGIGQILDRLEQRPLERHLERYVREVSDDVPFSVDGLTPREFPIVLEQMRQAVPGAQLELSITWNEDETLRVDVHAVHNA